jgi:tetraacyldisaccharide 4'-kinase
MKAPHFWSSGLDPRSREAAPFTRFLLTPLAALYTWGIRRKLKTAAPLYVSVPIICVGNITTGGVGKTPIVEALRARATEKGIRAASLSRGYGGTQITPLKVDPSTHTANLVGDEPLMLATTGESWIGRNRAEAAVAMIEDGVQLIIMDDGHQNPSLNKDLSLVVIDADAPFGNGHVLPKGPLREPILDSLNRAEAIILTGDGPVPPITAASGLPLLRATLKPDDDAPSGPLVAFAGIGRPQKFFDGLAAAGGHVVEAVPYADHQTLSAGDLKFLHAYAKKHAARLITTTKDYARLSPDDRADILTFPVSADFQDEALLDTLLAPLFEAALK